MAQESLALAALKAKTKKQEDETEPSEKPMSLGALAAAQKKPPAEPAKKYTIHGDGKPAKGEAPKPAEPKHGERAPNQTYDLGDKTHVWDSVKRKYVPKTELTPVK
jgi:hypothetical protein